MSKDFNTWMVEQQININGYLGWHHKWRLKVGNNTTLLTLEEYMFKAFEVNLTHPNQIGQETYKYNLSRIGDKGDYTVDNCRFLTTRENHKERDFSFLSNSDIDRVTPMIGNTNAKGGPGPGLNHSFTKGSNNGKTKLTEEQVIEIFYDSRPPSAVAKSYPIGPEAVSHIQRRIRWTHLTKDLIK